jgi:hypothetical protein
VKRRSPIRSPPPVSSTRFHGPAEKVNSRLAAAPEPSDPRISTRNGFGAAAAITLNMDTSKSNQQKSNPINQKKKKKRKRN